MAKRSLKVVRLLEPDMCDACRFRQTVAIEYGDGEIEKVIHCRRLDCDNWDYSSAQNAKFVNPVDK